MIDQQGVRVLVCLVLLSGLAMLADACALVPRTQDHVAVPSAEPEHAAMVRPIIATRPACDPGVLCPREIDAIDIVGPRRDVFMPAFEPRPVPCERLVALAAETAEQEGLETGLLLGVMRVESGFMSNALSPVGAVGLMQVMPLSGRRANCGELLEPVDNVACGAHILASFLRYYKGNLTLALSGYNAGHGMPDRAKKESRIPRNFQYVEDVLRARARFLRSGCSAW